MEFILTLSIATLIIFLLSVKIWKKTRSVSFILGVIFLYYWSLAGSWIFYFDAISGFEGKEIGLHYYYFFDKLFEVHVNPDFLMSIILYSLFIILIQTSLLFVYKKQNNVSTKPIMLSLKKLMFFMLFFLILSLAFISSEIYDAFTNNLILYNTVELSANKFFSLHQLTFQLAITTLILTISIYFSIDGTKMQVDRHNLKYHIILLFCFGTIIAFLTILGNKKELLFAGMVAILFFISNNRISKRSSSRLLILIFAVVIPLFATDIVRGAKFRSLLTLDIIGEKSKKRKIASNDVLGMIFFSNELFFPNFSMYGALNQDIPVKPAISLKYLASSLIPRAIKPERPEDVYTYYVRQVNAEKGQGYTIHHATAWLLNFGIVGVLIGAVLLGFVWGKLAGLRIRNNKKVFRLIVVFLAPAISCAYIPALIRSGMEGYKAFLIEGILLTCLVVYFSNENFKIKLPFWKK